MIISLNNKEAAIIEAKVTVEKEQWADAQNKAYNKLAADVEVKGFRKGKAPLDLAKKQVNPQKALDEAINTLVPLAYEELLKEHKFDVLMQPSVGVEKVEPEELTLVFTITVRPEIKLGTYKGLKVEIEASEVTDEEINAELVKIQEKNALVSKKEGTKVEKGDIVKFDFEGFAEGKPFDGGKADNFELTIGSNQFIPGFEDAMVGIELEAPSEINVVFPEQYAKELAGKPATFKVLVHEISTKTLPEINDELACDENIDGVDTLDALKENIKSKILASKEQAAKTKAMNTLIDDITATTEVEIPSTLIANDIANNFEGFKKQVESQGIPFASYLEIINQTEEQVKEQMKEDVVKNARVMFTLSEIAKVEKITVVADDVEAEFKNIAETYKMDLAEVKKALAAKESEIVNNIYNKKLSDFLKAENTIA